MLTCETERKMFGFKMKDPYFRIRDQYFKIIEQFFKIKEPFFKTKDLNFRTRKNSERGIYHKPIYKCD